MCAAPTRVSLGKRPPTALVLVPDCRRCCRPQPCSEAEQYGQPHFAVRWCLDRVGMRMCLAQLDFRLGDLEANARRAREAIARAAALGAELVVFPELALCGYSLAGVDGETTTAPAELRAIAGERRRSCASASAAATGAPSTARPTWRAARSSTSIASSTWSATRLSRRPPCSRRQRDARVHDRPRALRRDDLQRRVAAGAAHNRRRRWGRRAARAGGELDRGAPRPSRYWRELDPLLCADARVLRRVREPGRRSRASSCSGAARTSSTRPGRLVARCATARGGVDDRRHRPRRASPPPRGDPPSGRATAGAVARRARAPRRHQLTTRDRPSARARSNRRSCKVVHQRDEEQPRRSVWLGVGCSFDVLRVYVRRRG